MKELVAIVAVLAPFVFVLALVWLVLAHRRSQGGRPTGEPERLAQLSRTAERMEHRIDALERILDAEAPGWRQRHDSH